MRTQYYLQESGELMIPEQGKAGDGSVWAVKQWRESYSGQGKNMDEGNLRNLLIDFYFLLFLIFSGSSHEAK